MLSAGRFRANVRLSHTGSTWRIEISDNVMRKESVYTTEIAFLSPPGLGRYGPYEPHEGVMIAYIERRGHAFLEIHSGGVRAWNMFDGVCIRGTTKFPLPYEGKG